MASRFAVPDLERVTGGGCRLEKNHRRQMREAADGGRATTDWIGAGARRHQPPLSSRLRRNARTSGRTGGECRKREPLRSLGPQRAGSGVVPKISNFKNISGRPALKLPFHQGISDYARFFRSNQSNFRFQPDISGDITFFRSRQPISGKSK